jgi:hypothetical protein
VGSLLTFDIPQTALVATLDTYDFICIIYLLPAALSEAGGLRHWNDNDATLTLL